MPLETENDDTLCNVCSKHIKKNKKFVTCSFCKLKLHIKCANLNYYSYTKLNHEKEIHLCTKCNKENLPFF